MHNARRHLHVVRAADDGREGEVNRDGWRNDQEQGPQPATGVGDGVLLGVER